LPVAKVYFLGVMKMDQFLKYKNCPTSQELLAYRDSGTTPSGTSDLSKHLAECEFCYAEQEFYAHYPQTDDLGDTRQIPAPLYELAEALLSKRRVGSAGLESLAGEDTKTKRKSK